MKNYKSKFQAKTFGLILLLFAFEDATAQQLISNGGFETTAGLIRYRQSSTWNAGTFATGWGPVVSGSTPDIFTDNASANDYWYNENGANLTCYPEVFALDNMFGQQNPRAHTMAQDGNTFNHNYVFLFSSGEFIEQELPSTLVAGDCYELSYWINRGDVSGRAYCAQAVISPSGFSAQSIPFTIPPTAIYLTTADQPNVGQQGYIVDKVNWTKVTFQFKAQGGEKFITIGDFDNYSEKIEVLGPTDCGASNSCSSTCNAIIGNGQAYYYFYDDVSLIPISSSSFPNPISYCGYVNTPASISTNYTGANLLLTGDITISGNCTWSNCQVRCNGSTKIHIPTGSSLTINNGTVLKSGCDLMWQGIIVEGSGRFYMTSSTIEDALTALTVNGTGGWQIGGTATANSYFNKNERDIVINGTSQYTNFIKSTVFDHTIPLANPAQGIGGYGIEGVVVNPQTSATAISIGGTNMADICQFKEGQYGIRSKDANVDVNRTLFTGIKQVAVDFQGLNPGNSLRKLTFTASSAVNSKRCIFSQHRTDLTVQSSSFAYATEHAIDWEDNHDGHLLIGDTADAAKGNTFTSNYWCAVVAWDNKTNNGDASDQFAGDTSGLFTTINISNNTVTAPIGGGGFLIGEWTQSSHPTYHDLIIINNTLNNVTKGIQFYNARGLGGLIPATYSGTIPDQKINENEINITTAATATAFGVRDENNPGFEISDNTIGSTTPGDWQNAGIIFTNSEYSNVFRNAITAGTGIAANCDVLGSNIHCNFTDNNMSGITLAWAYLRQGDGYYHGSNLESFPNSLTTYATPQVQIHLYNSDRQHNEWVWNTDPTPTVFYSGNTGTGYLFTNPLTGTDNCYIPLNSILRDTIHAQIDLGSSSQQWTADYNYEAVRLNTGYGDSTVASSNIKTILSVERMMDTANYTGAKSALATVSSPNSFEENYADVLSIFADINYPAKRDPDAGEMSTLTTIASLYPRTSGPAVTLARAYLAARFNMYFKDEGNADTTLYGSAAISSPCSVEPYSKTYLGFVRSDGADIGVTPAVVEADGSFIFDPFTMDYMRSTFSDTVRIYSIHGSQYTVVDKEFKTFADWISSSPVSLTMSGVSLILDTLTSEPYTSITSATQFTDASGNTYYAGTATVSGHRDMSLIKKDSRNSLIWQRTWDGPVSGDDTATCITSDAGGNIYIAGKVWNGSHYEAQALKYDVDGFLQWSIMLP